jgi:hypothetical protein
VGKWGVGRPCFLPEIEAPQTKVRSTLKFTFKFNKLARAYWGVIFRRGWLLNTGLAVHNWLTKERVFSILSRLRRSSIAAGFRLPLIDTGRCGTQTTRFEMDRGDQRGDVFRRRRR